MNDDVREHFSGWLKVGCGAFFTLVLPLWILITGVTIQLSPRLNGLEQVVEGDGGVIELGYVEEIGWNVWIAVGLQMGMWMALALPVILVVIAIAQFVSFRMQRRSDSERHERDVQIRDDVVLKDVDWSTPAPDDEIHSGP